MRVVLDFKVGDRECTGIWDEGLGMGRLIWLDGAGYDLCSPRDQKLIDRICREGVRGASTEGAGREPEQLTLF